MLSVFSQLHAWLASLFPPSAINRPLENVGEAGKTRQKKPKKRVLNEHFEAVFNAVLPTQVVFQRPVNAIASSASVAGGAIHGRHCSGLGQNYGKGNP
ncbi:MAG: hypothetical protein ACK5NQ_16605 [Pseudomonas sp.]